MIILISGKQGSGKSTLANALCTKFGPVGAVKTRFAQALYEMHDCCRAILAKYNIDRYEFGKKDGNLLQLLGTEWGRKTIRETVWVETVLNQIRNAPKNIVHIIEDCRFRNEFDAFHNVPNVIKIRLNCSEEIRKGRAEMWRENSSHPSEIDLDEYAELMKFDMSFNTAHESIDDIVEKIMNHVRLIQSKDQDHGHE